MDAWVCSNCHARIPQKAEPKQCPLCGSGNRGKFVLVDIPEQKPDEMSKKYDAVMDELNRYRDGCEPEPVQSLLSCDCGHGEHAPRKAVKR